MVLLVVVSRGILYSGLFCFSSCSLIVCVFVGFRFYKQVTTNHLEAFAREGLRTLCCAVAEIPHDIYEEWKHTYHRASVSMQNREEKLADAANLIENNLVLLGATAIEDKLQDEVNVLLSLSHWVSFLTLIFFMRHPQNKRFRKQLARYLKRISACGC